MREIILIAIAAVFVENFVLSKFLGICPFLGVSKKTSTAVGMGGAIIFVITLSSTITWLIYEYMLKPNELTYLRTIVFILVIAALVQLVETVMKKFMPSLYRALGIYLPLITTNCAVLGAALLIVEREYTLLQAVVFGFASAVGFTLALVLFSGVRERIETNDIPAAFQGLPITLVAAALVSVAFFGFQGLFGI